jgi:hypothetical protein
MEPQTLNSLMLNKQEIYMHTKTSSKNCTRQQQPSGSTNRKPEAAKAV